MRILMLAAVLLGQVAAGEITGVVKDPAGAAVPGATVTITSVDTNLQRVVVSSGEGVYTAPSLAPGNYRVDVERTGFKPVRRAGIRLSTGEKARIDFDLAVGGVREQVTVTADASILRAETASLGAVIEHEQVVQFPINGRTFILLAGLAPGVALPPNSQLPRINGGRPRTNEYLFDGISVLQPEPGMVAFFPVVDAIQEFKIESNSPPAEFGRFNGGVVNLTTKAGGNVFHGDGFEFLRNEALNARNFFQSTVPVKPDYRRNQFGGTLGGPLVKDHTFFFVDYQGQRQSIARTVTSTV
ncbi:MAG TPA: carboxypeptidase-like regulatory domain-containing protein, partial [Vicinamibacterales bacterium]|nr:carboxypeptidase-like regulatory domain-containing protein [Vicinamibacterales bacterium]